MQPTAGAISPARLQHLGSLTSAAVVKRPSPQSPNLPHYLRFLREPHTQAPAVGAGRPSYGSRLVGGPAVRCTPTTVNLGSGRKEKSGEGRRRNNGGTVSSGGQRRPRSRGGARTLATPGAPALLSRPVAATGGIWEPHRKPAERHRRRERSSRLVRTLRARIVRGRQWRPEERKARSRHRRPTGDGPTPSSVGPLSRVSSAAATPRGHCVHSWYTATAPPLVTLRELPRALVRTALCHVVESPNLPHYLRFLREPHTQAPAVGAGRPSYGSRLVGGPAVRCTPTTVNLGSGRKEKSGEGRRRNNGGTVSSGGQRRPRSRGGARTLATPGAPALLSRPVAATGGIWEPHRKPAERHRRRERSSRLVRTLRARIVRGRQWRPEERKARSRHRRPTGDGPTPSSVGPLSRVSSAAATPRGHCVHSWYTATAPPLVTLRELPRALVRTALCHVVGN
ncbi:hypothetical protein ISCGN_018177 [Ixodes scapularis]